MNVTAEGHLVSIASASASIIDSVELADRRNLERVLETQQDVWDSLHSRFRNLVEIRCAVDQRLMVVLTNEVAYT